MIQAKIRNLTMLKEISNAISDIKNKRIKTAQNKADIINKSQIVYEITEAQKALLLANDNFDFVTDSQLLSMHIYEIKAAEEKLQYLMKVAREYEIEIPLTVKRIC